MNLLKKPESHENGEVVDLDIILQNRKEMMRLCKAQQYNRDLMAINCCHQLNTQLTIKMGIIRKLSHNH